MKSKVSSTGIFHFGLPQKQKIGLSYTDFVIYLHIKRLQKNNPHWNLHWNPHWTRTGTLTEKYRFWGSRRQTLVSQNPGDDDTNETNYMYGLMTISGIPLQRYNKNLRFPNFREYLPQFLRQSVLTLKPMEHFGAQKQDAAPSCWKDSKNRRCCHVSYE